MRHTVRRFLCGVLLAAVPVCVHAADPSVAANAAASINVGWRFDSQGRFPNIQPPSEWGTVSNVLWTTDVEVGGYSSPVVAGNRVFVTAEMGSLICLDLATGQVLWQKDLFSKGSSDIPTALSPQLMRGCGGDSKQSTPTPASNGRLVFYINAMGLCACYDLQGHQKWLRVIETAEDEESFSASPIFVGDRIIVHWGCLLALDAKDGRTLWKCEKALPTYGTPAITEIGGVAVVVTPGGDIVKLADGELLSSRLFKSTYATPLIEDGIIYVVDARSKALTLPAKAEPGMQLKERWRTRLSGEFMASPILKDGILYTIESKTCRVHRIDATTGESLMVTGTADADQNVQPAEVKPGLKIAGLVSAKFTYASPVATERNVFFFDDSGNTAVLEPGRALRLMRINRLGDAHVGTPFFVDNRIIIRGTRSVLCVGTER